MGVLGWRSHSGPKKAGWAPRALALLLAGQSCSAPRVTWARPAQSALKPQPSPLGPVGAEPFPLPLLRQRGPGAGPESKAPAWAAQQGHSSERLLPNPEKLMGLVGHGRVMSLTVWEASQCERRLRLRRQWVTRGSQGQCAGAPCCPLARTLPPPFVHPEPLKQCPSRSSQTYTRTCRCYPHLNPGRGA